MLVSTCSFGSSGSSAVTDYLRECENVQVLDALEFNIAAMVDGLEDLEYHLMKRFSRQSSSIYAIQRFRKAIMAKATGLERRTGASVETVRRLTDRFLEEITQVTYVGPSPMIDKKHSEWMRIHVGNSLIRSRILKKLEKSGRLKKNVDVYPFDTVQVSVMPPNFYDAAKRFTEDLLKAMGADLGKIVVMDQAFSGNDPAKSFPFYPDPYAVVVDRDPRDMYIFAKKFLLSKGRFMPTDTVENFITYYRIIRQGKERRADGERILNIRFEEMVYDYENAVKKIDAFLHVKNIRPKSVFVPEMSVANTNLLRRFPEFRADAEKIEKELPEYLFDFSAYKAPEGNGKMFYGRSPLNPNKAH